MKNSKTLIAKVKAAVETTAGVVGFSKLEFVEEESQENWILIEQIQSGIDMKIGIIIDRNAVSKNITNEINEVVKYVLKKESLKLTKLIIYIKGVA